MQYPVVVVGSGIVGSAVAFELQARGTPTILVERDVEPRGASAFSFASFSAFDEPLREVYALKCHGMAGWRKWAKRFGADLGVTWDGEIRWAEKERSAAQLRGLIDLAQRRGYPVHSIGVEDISRRLPGSAPEGALAASFAPEDGQADPVRAIEVLRDAFMELGGRVLVGRARLLLDESSVRAAIDREGIEASTVVIAAGAETATVLERLGWEIPMDASPELRVVTRPTDPLVTGTVYVAPRSDPEIHLRQLPDGRVLIGERLQDQVVQDPPREHARRLLHQAERSFPALASTSIDGFSFEWPPMPRDRLPIVGLLPGVAAIYLAAAHFGVTLAPAIGELVAQEAVGAGRPLTGAAATGAL